MALCDIFSVPIYSSRDKRASEWSKLLSAIHRLKLTGKNQYSFADLNQLVLDGFLSARSASYFLLGKASVAQVVLLDRFTEFRDMCLFNHVLSSFKILDLWQKTDAVVPENIFLYPLEELDSSIELGFDFSSEVENYNDCDLRDLQKF